VLFRSFVANVTPSNGTVDRVDFSSSNTSVASLSPASDSTSPYNTTATGVSPGTVTISTSVVMNGVSTCSDTANLTITSPGPWWQVKDGDVTTNGDILSPIPATCTLPGCNPIFGLTGDGGYPGVPAYGGSADFKEGSGTGIPSMVSAKSWLVNSQTNFRKTYDYKFFTRQIPSDVQSNIVEITSTSVNGGYFNSGGTPARGYVWYHYKPASPDAPLDLTINGNLNLTGSRKVAVIGRLTTNTVYVPRTACHSTPDTPRF
jgi:hypothetical protein